MEKARKNFRFSILMMIVAALGLIGIIASTQTSYADMYPFEYKITINKLDGNPYADKHGTEFIKYEGTDFRKYGSEEYDYQIWYYDLGHGKMFINADPNHYKGEDFLIWTSENDPDSIWGTYAATRYASTGEYIGGVFLKYEDGYSFTEMWGASEDIDIEADVEASLIYADAELDRKSFTYTGKEIKPSVTVKLDGVTLTEGVDYVVQYEDNIKVGDEIEIPSVVVTADALDNPYPYNPELDARVIYEKRIPFKILKADHPGIKATAKTAAVKYKKVKSKTQTVSMSQAVNVTGRKGTLKYTVSPVGAKAKKALTYKNGRIYVKKGTKKGLYKFKVTVMDRGGRNYKASAKKTITAKIRVK